MKKIFGFLLIAVVAVSAILLNACKKDENKDSYGLSEVTTFPVFTLEGGNFIVEMAHEGSWTDPGAVAHIDDTEVEVVSEGTVDPSVPGLYLINYNSLDETGVFPVSTERKVLIVSSPLTADYTGKYQVVHATRTNIIDVVSMGGETLGWYRASDTWFQNSKIPVEFVDLGTGLMVIPGSSPFGPHDGTVEYNDGTGTLTFKMVFTGGGNAGISWTTSWTKQ